MYNLCNAGDHLTDFSVNPDIQNDIIDGDFNSILWNKEKVCGIQF